jgi:hypothetical protein
VLIDPAGIVQLHHIGQGPADRPPVSLILNLVRQQSPLAPRPAKGEA